MKVFVYFNLRKKVWSVRSVRSGLVIDHKNDIILKDAVFKVSEAGRQRVLRDKRKNVHAGVEGELATDRDINNIINHADLFNVNQARYNPYKYESFVNLEEKPVYKAALAQMYAVPTKIVTYE